MSDLRLVATTKELNESYETLFNLCIANAVGQEGVDIIENLNPEVLAIFKETTKLMNLMKESMLKQAEILEAIYENTNTKK